MPFTPESITNEEIVKEYKEAAIDIAQMFSKLKDHLGHFERIEDITSDNGDPAYTAHAALEALGDVLSACVIYADEYEKDPYKNPFLENKKND